MDGTRHPKFVAIVSWVSAPQICDLAVPFDVTGFYVRFMGVNMPRTRSQKSTKTQNRQIRCVIL